MGASIILVRKDHADRLGPGILFLISQHLGQVVMVDHGDIAQAAINGFDLGAVVALGFSRQVFLYALQPALGGVQPVGRDMLAVNATM